MMQCGSSLRGQDSGLTDDGGVFNNIFIIHIIRQLCRTLAVVRCVILPLSQFHITIKRYVLLGNCRHINM